MDVVVVLGAGVGDLGGGLVELGLAEFDDGAAAELVAGLGQIEGLSGVVEELLGQVEAFVGVIEVEAGVADVLDDGVFGVAKRFLGGLRAVFGFGGFGGVQAAIGESLGRVPRRDRLLGQSGANSACWTILLLFLLST